jgi:hypothetical protein
MFLIKAYHQWCQFFIPSGVRMLVALSKNKEVLRYVGISVKHFIQEINCNYSGVVPLCLLRPVYLLSSKKQ